MKRTIRNLYLLGGFVFGLTIYNVSVGNGSDPTLLFLGLACALTALGFTEISKRLDQIEEANSKKDDQADSDQ